MIKFTHHQWQAIALHLLLVVPASILVACGGTGQNVTSSEESLVLETPKFDTNQTLLYGESESPLSDEQWRAALVGVFDVVEFGPEMYGALHWAAKLTIPSDQPVSDLGSPTRVECLSGYYDVTQLTASGDSAVIDANNCALQDVNINGSLEYSSSVNDTGFNVDAYSFKDFVVDSSLSTVKITKGQYKSDDDHPFQLSSMQGLFYSVQYTDENYSLTNTNSTITNVYGTAFDRYVDFNAIVSASWTLEQPLLLTTPRTLIGSPAGARSGDAYGTLVLESAQGDQLMLDIDNGQDDETALVTLTRSGVVTTEFVAWSDLFEVD